DVWMPTTRVQENFNFVPLPNLVSRVINAPHGWTTDVSVIAVDDAPYRAAAFLLQFVYDFMQLTHPAVSAGRDFVCHLTDPTSHATASWQRGPQSFAVGPYSVFSREPF